MRAAIMQPYFLPYIGYFQLIAAVDLFVVYDNIKYTKKGWINRNRFLQGGKDAMFSLPLKQDSDHLDIRERELAASFLPDKLLNQLAGAYRSAPFFHQTYPLLERILRHGDANLFRFLHHSILAVCGHLGIPTELRVSSSVGIDHHLKGQEKVLALCRSVGADSYLNAIGGLSLYSREAFREKGIALQFIKLGPFEYPQFEAPFVPSLSILDVMMFNPVETIQACLRANYELV